MLDVVKWLTRIAAAVMLVFWIPATSFCLWESAGLFVGDHCCPASESSTPVSEPASDSPCCLLASGSYKVNDDEQVVLSSTCLPLLPVVALIDLADRLGPLVWNPPTSPPPLLQSGWQFFFRTALPPRAPSIVL